MKDLVIYLVLVMIMIGCKSEPAVVDDQNDTSEIGIQEQDKAFKPYLNKEQVFKDNDSVVTMRVKFHDNNVKSITEYYEGSEIVKMVKYFTNDKQDGRSFVYFKDGKLKEVQHFKEGKQFDKDSIFYETGELRFVYSFENDKKNGWMYRYDKKGRQEFAANYKDDKVVEVIDSLHLKKK